MSRRRSEPAPAKTARRRFLKAAGVCVLLGSSGIAAALLERGAARASAALRLQLGALFRSPRKARALGERYLALRPDAADRRVLMSRLGFDGARVSSAALRARLAGLRERDFAQRRIVAIDGWVLAQSEAEVCALLSLG